MYQNPRNAVRNILTLKFSRVIPRDQCGDSALPVKPKQKTYNHSPGEEDERAAAWELNV